MCLVNVAGVAWIMKEEPVNRAFLLLFFWYSGSKMQHRGFSYYGCIFVLSYEGNYICNIYLFFSRYIHAVAKSSGQGKVLESLLSLFILGNK